MDKDINFRRKSFGSMVSDYQKYRKPYDERIYEIVFKSVKTEKRELKILDLGCGSGKSTEPLMKYADRYGLTVIGCDHDATMLKEAKYSAHKQGLAITYVLGEAEKLPFSNAEFDIVVAGTSFHWFANQTAFTEIRRVLKPGGLFFVFWKNATNILDGTGNKVAQDVFEKFRCTSILGNWRDIGTVRRIFEIAGFVKFQTVKIMSEQKDTLEDIIGCHKTTSKYAALSLAGRVSYIDELTSAYLKALGDKPYFLSMRETTVCYAYSR